MDKRPEDDPRIYFAAERTFLAWLRTGLGLMGVGFAVARFGLFLREMQATQLKEIQPHASAGSSGQSVWFGVALVALGVAINVSAALRHITQVRQLHAGTWQPGKVSTGAIALAILLAVIGAGLAVYLLRMR